MFKAFPILLAFSLFFFAGFSQNTSEKVEKINSVNFNNLYKINDNLYRSEQPKRQGMRELEKLGVKTILNLRNARNDNNEMRNIPMASEHLRINTWKFSYNDIVNALIIIKKSQKPVLIHCLHGSDRTGAVVAAYRMTVEHWTKEDAIAEFKDPRFGYHDEWFPNILEVIEAIDIEKLKQDVIAKN